ncbi:aminopeptidase [Marinobacter pelagius]|uniref:aminopeptidase n=1 Tax=Marinobacter sp. C7 TaxID=2951363 RepID=UPI001EEFBBB1|nr:aminopeptidase [Marinobacter sp. C7]MCG7198231.1 aminopeptidase [Marinobacter sp. C7]
MKQLSQIYLLLLLITGLTGCTTIGYYTQAISGHFSLMTRAEPVAEVIGDAETRSELREKLELALEARRFAGERLALPVGEAYLEYVQLDHPWVVVNLVAVPEFSLKPHSWCYPMVGCQAYRGYFSLDDARREQAGFRDKGYDTFIGGVTAYSTLGWFDDPLHSGFTRLDEDRMVALMFHELAHRVVYISEDTTFNESFATAVELEGLRTWLEHRGEADRFEEALARLQRRNQTLALVREATSQLDQLYNQLETLGPETVRQRKQGILARLAEAYGELSRSWTEPGPFGPAPVTLNNANLALFRQYNQFVPGFRQLLSDHDHDFPAFYRAVEELGQQPPAKREAALAQLSQRFEEDL